MHRALPSLRRDVTHRLVTSLLAIPIASAFIHHHAAAQAREAFDSTRVWISENSPYETYHVTDTRPLREAMDDGTIDKRTYMVVMERPEITLAMVMQQVAWHHAVQGEVNGEPWMVSF